MAEIRVKETGTIKLFESDNTSSVTIASPASLGADRTITLPDASVTLASGTMLATDGSGASLTALNASELGSGTVPTARLGSGTASSSTFLAGDQTYKAAGGGLIRQVKNLVSTDNMTSTVQDWTDTGIEVTFDSDMADGNSKVMAWFSLSGTQNTDIGNSWAMFNYFTLFEGGSNRGNADRGLIGGNSLTDASTGAGAPGYQNYHMSGSVLFTPSTTTTPTITIYGRGKDPTYTWTWSVGKSAQYASTNYYTPTTLTIMEVTG